MLQAPPKPGPRASPFGRPGSSRGAAPARPRTIPAGYAPPLRCPVAAAGPTGQSERMRPPLAAVTVVITVRVRVQESPATIGRAGPAGPALPVSVGLGAQAAEVGGPVAERAPGPAAGRVGQVLGEGAALGDPLRGEPQVAAGGHGRAVVTPAGPGRWRVGAGAVEEDVLAEAVLRADTPPGDVDRTDVAAAAQRRVGGARVVVAADQGEGHDPLAVGEHGDGRVVDVVAGHADIALPGDGLGDRVDDEVGAGRLDVAGHLRDGVQRAVQPAPGQPGLLHAAVVGVERTFDLTDR